MVMSAEEYYNYLLQIQSSNPPTIAILPHAEKIYEVHLDSRKVDAPEYLSVTKDHKSETIYFKVNRFFDYMDLTETVCLIHYTTADNKSRVYHVPFYDITTCADENKILFPWCIDGAATAAAGKVKYAIEFYKIGYEGQKPKFLYNLNTLTAESKVLYGMDVTDPETPEFDGDYFGMSVSAYQELIAKIDALNKDYNIYWEDADNMGEV